MEFKLIIYKIKSFIVKNISYLLLFNHFCGSGMIFFRLLIFLCAASLYANWNSDSIITTENEPSGLIEGKVHAISGKWIGFDEDLTIQGVEPIHIRRSFIDHPDPDKNDDADKDEDWAILPHLNIQGIEGQHVKDGRFGGYSVKEGNGSEIHYRKTNGAAAIDNEQFWKYLPSNLDKGYSNTSQGKISSRTNLFNHYLLVGPREKTFILHCADGTIRKYQKIHQGNGDYRLLSEHLPNGRWILYEYQEVVISKKNHQSITNLVSIRTTNPEQDKVYAEARFFYADSKRKNKHFSIGGSDGQSVEYQFVSAANGRETGCLEKVISSQSSDQSFCYTDYENGSSLPPKPRPLFYKIIGDPHPKNINVIETIAFPLNRQMQVDYYSLQKDYVHGEKIVLSDFIERDPRPGDIGLKRWEYIYAPDLRRGRVKTLSAPVGADATLHTTHSFIYDIESKKCSVYAIDNQRTDYFWDGDFRLQKIDRYANDGRLKNSEQWGWNGHRLIAHTVFDSCRSPIWTKCYVYDSRGNVLEEKCFGSLSGRGPPIILDSKGLPQENNGVEVAIKRFRYSSSEPSLLLEEQDESGRRIVTDYLPGTDLPISRSHYDHEILQFRQLFEYSPDHILLRQIIDDGKTRKITAITPKPESPYLGMPWIIEEKYQDNQGERLLKKTVLTYTTGGRIAQRDIYDANGMFRYSLKTVFDAKGRTIEETNAIGQIQKCTFDACGNKTCQTDYSNRSRSTFNYDCSNRLISAEQVGDDEISLKSSYCYDQKSNPVREEKSFGFYSSNTYDSFGNVLIHQLPAFTGSRSPSLYKFSYDSTNRPIAEIDPNGGVKKTSYNAMGQPTRIEYPDGSVEELIYHLDGTLKTHIDPEGVETSYTYDFLQRPIRKTIVHQGCVISQELCEYDALHLIAKTDALGNRTTFNYDGAGRLIAQEINGERTSYSYDSLGRLFLDQTGELKVIKEFDLLDRVMEERREDQQGRILFQVSYEYDAAGNRNAVIRSMNDQTSVEHFAYDSMGRLIRSTDPLGAVTEIRYEELADGVKETIRDPLGVQTIKTYDARQNLAIFEIKKEKDYSREDYFYDCSGNLARQSSEIFDPPRTVSTLRDYDAMNRIKSLIEAADSRDQRTTSYSYNKKGVLSQMIKPDGTALIYSYDPLGYQTSLASSDGSIQYHYVIDPLGRLLQSTDMRSNQSTYRRYDPQGRLLEETLANGAALASTYDSMGRRTQLVLPDHSFIRYGYDALYLRTVSRHDSSGQCLYSHAFLSYDLSGQLLQEDLIGGLGPVWRTYDQRFQSQSMSSPFFVHQILEHDLVGNILKTRWNETDCHFTYDPLYQLTSESGLFSHSYQFDAHHGRHQKDDERYELNDLLQVPSHLSYDPNGNATRQKDTRYVYDALDRLIAVESPRQRLEFTYDSDHRRMSKTVYVLENGVFLEKNRQFYLYDGLNEIGAMGSNGQIEEFRVLGDTPNAEIGSAVAVELQGQVYAPLHDLMGNLSALVSIVSKQIDALYRYSSFGEENSTGTIASPWRFSSKRFDPETGLIYFGRRYYSPQLGIWITPDPAGYTDGINRYAFVHNNPLSHRDLYGLRDVCDWTPDSDYDQRTGIREYDYFDPEKHHQHDRDANDPEECNLQRNIIMPTIAILTESCLPSTHDLETDFFRYEPNEFQARSVCQQNLDYGEAVSCFFVEETIVGGQIGKMAIKGIGWAVRGFTKNIISQVGGKSVTLVNRGTSFSGRISQNNSIFNYSLDELSKAGKVTDRGRLTRAGRALEKHGNRPGSVFPKAIGNPAAKNVQGQYHLDDVLTHPHSTSYPNRFGGQDIYAPDGRGMRFDSKGNMMGFLQPRR